MEPLTFSRRQVAERRIGWANRTVPPDSMTPAATRAAIASSTSTSDMPPNRAASPICAPSPSALSTRASSVAGAGSRARRSSTAFATPRGTISPTWFAAAAVGSRWRAATSSSSSPRRNGLPPATSKHARTNPSAGWSDSRAATIVRIDASVRGDGRSSSTAGSATSAAASGAIAGSSGRVAAMSASGCPSIRRAMKASVLAEGPSHHWRSSTTSASGESAERLETSQ